MDQSPAFYAESSVAQVVVPWLAERLPRLDPTVVDRLVQLTTGILEHQSLLIEEIVRGSAFRATTESNATQVRGYSMTLAFRSPHCLRMCAMAHRLINFSNGFPVSNGPMSKRF